jgi:hypothetical protein
LTTDGQERGADQHGAQGDWNNHGDLDGWLSIQAMSPAFSPMQSMVEVTIRVKITHNKKYFFPDAARRLRVKIKYIDYNMLYIHPRYCA